jgi:16S rRNA (cytosine1402-N4)-methyltransferase
MSAAHTPVLLEEAMAALAPLAGATLVDATFGAGGYSRAALQRGAARVFALDRDPSAIAAARGWAQAEPRLSLIHERFSRMDAALARHGVAQVDAIAFDIGVSSMQLGEPERGFSFQADGPLDMRMSGEGPTAAEFLNSASEAEIARVLRELGEEPQARRVARAIVAARPLATTAGLAAVVRRALGQQPGQARDPATRTFQAIRIHVNDELGELERGLDAAERLLAPGGRLAVVSFHSLEDRIVKAFLRARSGQVAGASRHRPAVPATPRLPSFERPARPVRPSAAEVARNPRARSATLRAARRSPHPAWSQP